MIVNLIVDFLFGILNSFLSLIPDVDIAAINFSFVNPILKYFSMANYLFPFSAFIPLIVIFFTLQLFRIIIALLKTIWSILPLT